MDKMKKAAGKRNPAPKIKDLDAQQRKLAILKQKQCDAIALHIVNKLIECPVEEDVFLQSLKYMNQCHFQDIVEERAISKMCGYPVCANVIPEMPRKQFHISTKSNKIYDITDRKNYCSNYCYKAGIYIKEQMLTSPLWYRDKEEIPDFHLLPKHVIGTPGVEVEQGIAKLEIDDDDDDKFTSVSEFTKDAINEVADVITDKLNIVDEKEAKETRSEVNKTDPKSETSASVTEISIETETQYYTNLYMPNLADILKENAAYFDNQSNETPKDMQGNTNSPNDPKKQKESKMFNRTIINSKSSDESKKHVKDESKTEPNKHIETDEVKKDEDRADETKINVKEVPIIERNKYTETDEKVSITTDEDRTKKNVKEVPKIEPNKNTETNEEIKKKVTITTDEDRTEMSKSKGFDRTIINTKSDKKLKGILSKASKINTKNENKKQVSFSIQNTERKFRKPFSQNTENNSSIFKNDNLIGSVREKSDIYKYEMSCLNVSQVEYNANLTHENQFYKDGIPSVEESKMAEPEKCSSKLELNSSATEMNENGTRDVEHTENVYTKEENSLKLNENERENKRRLSRLKNSATYRRASHISNNGNKVSSTSFGNLKNRLHKYVREWITYETLLFLYGEDIKRKVSVDKLKEYSDRRLNVQLDDVKQKQYNAICKRLNLMELADRKFDESVTGKKLRPLPRYEELKKQAETMDLRVKAFYSGCHEVHEEDAESETESVKDEEFGVDKGVPAVLPLVESKDIAPLRRKIFLTSLSRVIPSICEVFKQCPNYLLSDLKKLIDTFNLNADNIVFKTNEWHLVGILLLKILSIRDIPLKSTMEEVDVHAYIISIISQFNIKVESFNELLLSESETKCFLENLIRQDESE